MDRTDERYAQYRSGRFTFRLTGVAQAPLSDIYYLLISKPWPWLLATAFVGFLVLNVVFAVLYLLGGDAIQGARPGSFTDAFYFSVQTFSTVGYGVLSPKTPYAHAVATVESFAGLLAVAVGTGIIFAKFSRPSARVTFSEAMVVHARNGVPTLQFRVANQRRNEVFSAHMEVHVFMEETTVEGQRLRRAHKLQLERADTPVFTAAWTVLHPITTDSPLHGLNTDVCNQDLVFIIAAFSGTDGTFLQTVQARHLYTPKDVRFDHQFVDMIENRGDGAIVVHHEVLHETQPVASENALFSWATALPAEPPTALDGVTQPEVPQPSAAEIPQQ